MPAFLAYGGEMGERIEAYEWSATLIGPAHVWPALRVALTTVLASSFPSVLVWSPGRITLIDDAYRQLLGDKPDALGRSFLDVPIWSRWRMGQILRSSRA